MPRPIRLLLNTTLALLLLLLLCAGMVAYLLGSRDGTRFVAAQVETRAGEIVQWSRLEGTLLDSLRLSDVRLSLPGLDLRIDDLYLAWQPWALVKGRVQVDAFSAGGMQLALTPAADSPQATPFNPADMSLPVAVELGKIRFSDLQVTVEGQTPLQIDSIELEAQFDKQRLALRSLAIRLPQGGLSLAADTVLAASMPLEVQASWDWLLTLPGDSADSAPGVHRTAQLQGDLSLEGGLQWLERTGFDLHYQLAVEGLQALDGELPARVNAGGDMQGALGGGELLLQQVSLGVADTPVAISLAGQVADLDAAEPRARLSLQWRGLGWPLQVQEPEIASPKGSISVDGTISKYQLGLAAELAGRSLPDSHWTLAGNGDASQLVLDELSGQVLGGELAASGTLQWDPVPRWQLQVIGKGLDPGQLQPEIPGQLTLSLLTNGQVTPAAGPEIDVLVQQLSGTLLEYPLQGTAQASILGELVQLVFVDLESQGNRLTASGDISPTRLDLEWQLDASNPGGVIEGAGGELSARGTVTGSPQIPRVEAQARGSMLRFDSYRAQSVSANLAAGRNAEDPLTLDLDIDQLVDGERELLRSLRIQAAGTMRRHQLRAAVNTVNEGLDAELNGGLDESLSAWQGQLTELSLDAADYGRWSLADAARLSIAAEEANLGESCLRVSTSRGRVCVLGNWVATGNSELHAQLQALPLDLFVPAVSGDISGNLHAALAAGGLLRVDSIIAVGSGEIAVDGSRRLAHGGGKLSLQVDEAGLLAQLQVAAPEQGQLQAVARLPALTALPMAGEQPLGGFIKAELPDLSGLAAWIPEISHSAGRLAADMQLRGSLAKPAVEGKLILENGAATLPLAGLELADLRLEALSDPSRPGRLALNGGMRSGQGQLAINGEANLEAMAFDFTLAGDRFQVFDTRDARVLLSPDLHFGWQDNTLRLRGQVTIPEAAITPKIQLAPSSLNDQDPQAQTPGQVIVPSPDVVVISETLDPALQDGIPDAPFRIDSQLRVQMGEEVRVNAIGFVSRISGAVDFSNTPDQKALIPLANGRFSIEEGTFRAFGQDLEIETGHLIFANVPATEPELNLRAVRWIDNDPQVTAAGILVTGPLNQPLLELFSRPQLEASEIQSYLLTGRSPRSRDSVLGIGTYISRRIYVGYGFNMLERTSEFNSLFNISPRYGVGSSVGEADNNINMTITYEH